MREVLKYVAGTIFFIGFTIAGLLFNDPINNTQPTQPTATARMANGQCEQVIMYSLTYCPACKYQKQVLKDAGIAFTAYEVDNQPQYGAQLKQKISQQKLRFGGYPTLEAGGRIFPYRTPPELLAKATCART